MMTRGFDGAEVRVGRRRCGGLMGAKHRRQAFACRYSCALLAWNGTVRDGS